MSDHQYTLTDPVARTLDAWRGDARNGAPVTLGEDVIDNAVQHIEYLASANRSQDVDIERLHSTIARLERQIANTEFRRAS